LPDGSYELRIPYRESRELVMDVMRQGAGVEALAPVELRRELADQLSEAASLYPNC
jgi:proteasome accessory factor C